MLAICGCAPSPDRADGHLASGDDAGAVAGHKRLHVALRRSLSHCIPGLSSVDPVLNASLPPVLGRALTNVQAAERFISPELGSLFGARSVTGLTDALRICRPSGEKSHSKCTYHRCQSAYSFAPPGGRRVFPRGVS